MKKRRSSAAESNKRKIMNRSVSHLTYIIQYHNNMLPYDINICLR